MDASRSLHVLAVLADVVSAVASDGVELPLTGLTIGSAVAFIDSPNADSDDLLQRAEAAFQHPVQLTRRLRQDLADAFRTRADYGIAGFGLRTGNRAAPFTDRIYQRVLASLSRPTGWASVTGVVRSVGRASNGVSGKIRNEVDGRVVNFEAPSALEEALKSVLFRRAILTGPTESDDDDHRLTRMVVERIEELGAPRRLSDLELGDIEFDSDATLRALQELRRG